MSWLYLLIAILFEVGGTTCLKLSEGMQNLKFVGLMLLCYIASLGLLSMALKGIEVGVAYAVWAGVGIIVITGIGILFFGESLDWKKVLFVTLIAVGTIGLNLTSSMHT